MNLYISDLDGTLLNDNAEVSSTTARILNGLIGKGLKFTIATARSLHTAQRILEPLNLNIPIILFNGVFVYDCLSKKYLLSNLLPESAFKDIIKAYSSLKLSPFVYTINKEGEHCIYYRSVDSKAAEDFLNMNLSLNDGRKFIKVDDYNCCCEDRIVTVNTIGKSENMLKLHSEFTGSKTAECLYVEDNYAKGFSWMYLTKLNSNKRSGIEYLKSLLGAQKLICFGDNLNDVPLMEAADESYAVSNAHERIKEMATGTIGSNNDDSVAKFIEKDFGEKEYR